MEINGQFGSHSSMTETARALVGVKQKREESIEALAGRAFGFSKGDLL